jgi:hypothetical protein
MFQGLWASLTNGGRRSNFFPVQCMVTLIHIYRRFFRACSRASLLLNHLTFLPSFSSPEGATGSRVEGFNKKKPVCSQSEAIHAAGGTPGTFSPKIYRPLLWHATTSPATIVMEELSPFLTNTRGEPLWSVHCSYRMPFPKSVMTRMSESPRSQPQANRKTLSSTITILAAECIAREAA